MGKIDYSEVDEPDVKADAADAENGVIEPASKVKAYRKFIAAVVGLVVTLGVLEPGLAQNIGGVLTALAVVIFPNED